MRAVPEGMRVYAVGDVHGRLDALDALLGGIGADLPADGMRAALVMLGDYVDRGPHSRHVLDLLIEVGRIPALETRFLRGNHEDAVLRFLDDPSVGPAWLGFGAAETLRSYGVAPPASDVGEAGWEQVRDEFADALPEEHLAFLRGLEPFAAYGDYFFVHAGARPGVPLDAQDLHDLLWIREDFLLSPFTFEKTVVHGHTPEEEPFLDVRRIGVDTGAFGTGRLTAVVLEGEDRRMIQAQLLSGRATVEHIAASPAPLRQPA